MCIVHVCIVQQNTKLFASSQSTPVFLLAFFFFFFPTTTHWLSYCMDVLVHSLECLTGSLFLPAPHGVMRIRSSFFPLDTAFSSRPNVSPLETFPRGTCHPCCTLFQAQHGLGFFMVRSFPASWSASRASKPNVTRIRTGQSVMILKNGSV